jgi:hypothetical protein
MDLKEIVKHLHKAEGKKSKVSIANIREVVALISDLLWKHPEAALTLGLAGKRRALRLEMAKKSKRRVK